MRPVHTAGLFLTWLATLVGASRTLDMSTAFELETEFINTSLASDDMEEFAGLGAATWTALKVIHDIHAGYVKTEKAFKLKAKRDRMIKQIVGGHTMGVAQIVKAAHAKLGEVKGGAKAVKNVMDSDTFMRFRDLLDIFEEAYKMCITEEKFFKNPFGWFARNFGKGPTEEQKEDRQLAVEMIETIVKSMRGVVDEALCPKLETAIRDDLMSAQAHVELWENVVSNGPGGFPISWYEMMYHQYDAMDKHPITEFQPPIIQSLRNPVLESSVRDSKRTKPSRERCFRGSGTEADLDRWTNDEGVDEFELVFEPSVPHGEADRMASQLYLHSTAIHEAMDRASVNAGTYDRDCRRVNPEGKKGLFNEIRLEMEAGEKSGRMAYTALDCDLCFRHGCRERGVFDVLVGTYRIIRWGVVRTTWKMAKKLLPKWIDQIVSTLQAGYRVLNADQMPAGRFYCAMVYLVSKGMQHFGARENCIKMGKVLHDKQLEDYEGALRALANSTSDD